MISVEGYTLIEKLHKSHKNLVYRARRNSDNASVILKILTFDHNNQKEISRLEREFHILKSLDIPGVAKADNIEKKENTTVLVLEDIGGQSLSDFIKSNRLNIKQFLKIASQIAEILGNIHKRSIIHKDLKPDNIIYNKDSGIIQIIDFNISSEFPKEAISKRQFSEIEGTLIYASPEQTGWMNRLVDYRTDFYTLGVTFFQLLTGVSPFASDDPLELIHAHLASAPPDIKKLAPEIPKPITDIIYRLLEKNPEDRYNTAEGIKRDLDYCLQQFENTGNIKPFIPGEKDYSGKIQIPEKIYGRNEEIQKLINSYQRVSGKTYEMMLITGEPGIGKSFLTRQLYKPVVQNSGFFISGKFEQFNRDRPFNAFIQAFDDLLNQVLTRNSEKIDYWKSRLINNLGSNIGLMTYLIPKLEIITGAQDMPKSLTFLDIQNRFHIIIINFLEVFAEKNNPLVLFIDDLQWADSSSLKLIEILATTPEFNHLLFICSYRNNELKINPVLENTLKRIEEFRKNYTSFSSTPLHLEKITLGVLNSSAVQELVKDSFRSSDDFTELGTVVFEKTAGNPFFVNRFLTSVFNEKYVWFDHANQRWNWDLKAIQKSSSTENVISLMKSSFEQSNNSVSEILKIASCIGIRFSLITLSNIIEKPVNEIRKYLNEAVLEGYIFTVNNDDLFTEDVPLQFQHDQIMTAANMLINEKHKKEIHLKIGNYLVAEKNKTKELFPPEKESNPLEAFIYFSENERTIEKLQNWMGKDIFTILNHFNSSSITDLNEKKGLAILNLIGARHARKSAAYESALDSIHTALKLLENDSWEKDYYLTLQIYTQAAECEYVSTNFKSAEDLCHIILINSKSIIDKIKVFEISIASLTPQNKFKDAIEAGISTLNELGVHLPKKPTPSSPLFDIISAQIKMAGKLDKIVDLPEMVDPIKIAAMNILIEMITPSFISIPNLFPVLVLKMVHLTLKYGLSSQSAYAFAFFGMIIESALGKFDTGDKLSKVALKIIEKEKSQTYTCKTLFVLANMLWHWKNPIEESQKILERSYKKGIESGDLLFASYALNWFNAYNYLKRRNLNETLEEMHLHIRTHEKIKQKDAYDFYKLWMQYVSVLHDSKKITGKIDGIFFSEDSGVKIWEKTNNDTDLFTYNMMKGILYYLRNDYNISIEFFEKALKHASGVFGMPVNVEHNFFYSLALSGLAHESKNKIAFLRKIKTNQKKLKTWCRHSLQNYEAKYLLVEAERKTHSKKEDCLKIFEDSKKKASSTGLIFEEALVNERIAHYYFRKNKEFIGRAYLKEAFSLYQRWGAAGKLTLLEEEYPEIFTNTSLDFTQTLSSSSGTMRSTMHTIDFNTVLKVSQNISSEIDLEKLTEKLVLIAIENAGASRGYLILERDGQLMIFAEGEGKNVKVMIPSPVETFEKISHGVINFVRQSGESVVINDTTIENPFQSDPYIVNQKPKSVLCLPVKKYSKLIGILYLENNFLTNVFTSERLSILSLLSTQAIISLENASYVKKITSINKELEIEISKHQKTEEDLIQTKERYALAARGANDGLWDWDLKNDRIYFSPRWKNMFGYEENEIQDYPSEWFQRVHNEDLPFLRSMIDSHIEGILPHLECEYRMKHKDGRYLWIITRGLAVRDEHKKAYRIAGSNTEITKRKIAEEQLRHDALFDNLTGLPNWNLLLDRAGHSIKRQLRQPNYIFAVLFFDVDRFKVINDSLGHEYGNHLLIDIGKRISEILRPEDTIARLGGDEFGILIEEIHDINQPILTIHRIRESLEKPFLLNNHELVITISIGIVINTGEYSKPEDLIRDADTAMHRAKSQGKNRYEIFNKEMHSNIIEFFKTESELRKALEINEFEMFYQPIVNTKSGKLIGAEALIRWKHNHKIISPGTFIPLAEETGLIIPIGEWVLKEAFRQKLEWSSEIEEDFILSVNISSRQFTQKNFIDILDDTVKSFNVNPASIQLELTESTVMENIKYARETLNQIRNRNFKIAIDDFGTGYSSLSYLKEFPVQKLKIDRSFIMNMVTNSDDDALVKAIIAMGQSLQMKVIAEGVETIEQLELLKKHECDEIQGYYYSQPVSAMEFQAKFIRKN